MNLLARIQGRSGFNLTYTEILDLPVSLRDRMLEQIDEWRAQEDSSK